MTAGADRLVGVDRFRDAFAKHRDKFVVIGGMAAALQAEEVGGSFRLTKDFDIVLVIEALDDRFLSDFWAFVNEGGYTFQKANGEKDFYRFVKPSRPDFPQQLELFSRKPDLIKLPANAHITPIPGGEDASSLSAILLDDDYYGCLIKGCTEVQGIPVLGNEMIIPFKAYAHINLLRMRAEGQEVKDGDLEKHRADVFRVLALLRGDTRVELPASVRAHLMEFLSMVAADNGFDPREFTRVDKTESIARLKLIYGIG